MRIDPFCALLRFLAPYVQFDSFWSINSALSLSMNQQKKTYLDFEQINNIRV